MKSVTRYNSAKELAGLLQKAGFNVLKHSEPNDVEDGEITITDKLHVQVPMDYVAPNVVLEVEGPAFIFGGACDQFGDLVASLKAAADQGENWNGKA